MHTSYMYIHVHVYTCMYMYIHAYTCMYMYIYICLSFLCTEQNYVSLMEWGGGYQTMEKIFGEIFLHFPKCRNFLHFFDTFYKLSMKSLQTISEHFGITCKKVFLINVRMWFCMSNCSCAYYILYIFIFSKPLRL